MSRVRWSNANLTSKTTKLKLLLIFAKQYTAVLQQNLTSYFNCCTNTLCQKYKSLCNSRPYFHPCNSSSTDDSLSDIDQSSNFVGNIAVVFKTKEELQKFLFQPRETRKYLNKGRSNTSRIKS